jgi:glycerophosphoryl diester phosphodiesterase
MDRPILIAHRGGALEAPENTMAAFRHAIHIGMRFVELDTQMTRDGELVVIHDETLDRTTTGVGLVSGYILDQVRQFDAGVKFGPQFAGEVVPTLREALDLCMDNGVGVVIKLKALELNPGMEEKVAALLGEMWLRGAENLWCISFDRAAIRRMRALDAALPLGYLYLPTVENFAEADDVVQVVCPYFGLCLQHPEQVERAHELGKFVFVYTVNDAEDMRRLASVGVDGMVTDRPTLLMEALHQPS